MINIQGWSCTGLVFQYCSQQQTESRPPSGVLATRANYGDCY